MLLTIQIILETLAGCTVGIAILCALIGYIKNAKPFYGISSTLLYITGIVWGVNILIEYFMGIYTSAILTAILVCMCLYFGRRLDHLSRTEVYNNIQSTI